MSSRLAPIFAFAMFLGLGAESEAVPVPVSWDDFEVSGVTVSSRVFNTIGTSVVLPPVEGWVLHADVYLIPPSGVLFAPIVAVVPEPTSLHLLALGLVGLTALVRARS